MKMRGLRLGRSARSEREKRAEAKSRFVDNGDGTVTDTVTALQWQKEDDGIERDYDGAQRYARELRLAGYADWRLPCKEELVELANVGYKTLNRILPNTKAEGYWAETCPEELQWTKNPDEIAYAVEFDPASANYGADVTYLRTYSYYVRAVRDAG